MPSVEDIIEKFGDLPEKTKEKIRRDVIKFKEKNKFLNENGVPIPLKIAKDILEKQIIITTNDNEDMYHYNGGIYHNGTEILLKEETQKRVADITIKGKNEVIELIHGLTYKKREILEQKKRYVHLKNGIYDLETDKFIDFDPDIVSTTMVDVDYDESADCPKIKAFIKEVVGEQWKIVQEMFGYCLYKDYVYNKAFMLFGGGKNGKTTFLNLLLKFLGEKNICSVSLQDLLYNRFAKRKLYGKLANIYDDLPNSKLKSTGNFKILTGKGLVWADIKFKEGFEFRNYGKLIFSCNELPGTEDTTNAFFRRWVLLKFDQIFEGKNDNPEILEEIATPVELSGLFNWAVEGLRRIKTNNGFSESITTQDIKEEWITRTDPLRAFFNLHVTYNPGKMVKKSDMVQAINEFCQDHSSPEITSQAIGQKIPSIFPKVKSIRTTINEKQERVWLGIDVNKKILVTYPYQIHYLKGEEKYTYKGHGLDRYGYPSNYKKVMLLLSDNLLSYFELESKAQGEGIEEEEFQEIIKQLKETSKIYEPRVGYLKKL